MNVAHIQMVLDRLRTRRNETSGATSPTNSTVAIKSQSRSRGRSIKHVEFVRKEDSASASERVGVLDG